MSESDIAIRLVVTDDGSVVVSNFETAITQALRKSAEETKKASAEAAAAVTAEEKKKEEARRAGLSSFQRSLEDTNKSLTAHAKAISDVNPAAGSLIQKAAEISQSMQVATKGGLAGFFGALSAGQAVLEGARKGLEILNTWILEPVKNFSELSRTARDMSTILGTNVQDFGALSKAVEMNGGSIDIVRQGLGYMTNQLKTAAQTGDLTGTSFARLGIDIKNQDGTLKTSTQLFSEIADKLNTLPDGMRKTALSVGFFGEEAGAKMLPQLKLGSAGIKAMTSDLVLLTSQVNDSDVAMSERFLKALNTIGTASDALSNQLVRGLQRSLTGTIERFAEFAQGTATDVIRAFGGQEQMVARLAGAFDLVKAALQPFVGIAALVAAALLGIGSVVPIVIGTLAEMASGIFKVISSITSVISSLASLVPGLEDVAESAAFVSDMSTGMAKDLKSISDGSYQTANAMLAGTKRTGEYGASMFDFGGSAEKATVAQKNLGQAVDATSFILMRADEEVQKARVALNNRQLTSAQEIAKAEIAARNDVLSAEINNQAFLRTESERTKKALIDKSTEIAQAQDALRMADLTKEQDQTLRRISLQQQITEAAQERASTRANHDVILAKAKVVTETELENSAILRDQASALRSEKLALGKIEAETRVEEAKTKQYLVYLTQAESLALYEIQKWTEVAEAEIGLEARRITAEQTYALSRIKYQGDILTAQQERVTVIQNAELRAQREIETAETRTETMRQQIIINRRTREEQLKQAILDFQAEIEGKEVSVAAMKMKLMNDQLLLLDARKTVEEKIVGALLQQKQAKMEDAVQQDVVNKLSREGLDTTTLLANSASSCASGFNSAAGAVSSLTSNLSSAVGQATTLVSQVNLAAGGIKQMGSGMEMGNADGGVTVGDRFIPYPTQGLPGAAGMSAAANFAADVASAKENERQKKRQDEVNKRFGGGGTITSSGGGSTFSASGGGSFTTGSTVGSTRGSGSSVSGEAGLGWSSGNTGASMDQDSRLGMFQDAAARSAVEATLDVRKAALADLLSLASWVGGPNPWTNLTDFQSFAKRSAQVAYFGPGFDAASGWSAWKSLAEVVEAKKERQVAEWQASPKKERDNMPVSEYRRSIGLLDKHSDAMPPWVSATRVPPQFDGRLNMFGSKFINGERAPLDLPPGVDRRLIRYAGGTGLEGVPGFGYGDTVPTMLQPREIVMRRDESDVLRALANAAVTSPITSSITSSSVATSAASVGSTGSYSGPSASEIAAAIVAALRVSPMNVKADVDVSVQVDRREIARAVQEEAADGGFTISERNVKRF